MTRRNLITMARSAMGCEVSVIFPAAGPSASPAGYAALDEIDRLEAKLSVYRSDSAISCLNRAASIHPAPVDGEVLTLLDRAARIFSATAGAFDCSIGALIRAWGFYQGPRRVPEPEELEAARAASGMAHVVLDSSARTVHFKRPGIEINLGAIGKGFAVDRALDCMRRHHGTTHALVQAGQSSFAALGTPPGEPEGWLVAIADPFRQGREIALVRLKDRAMGTSGAEHQFFVHEGRRYGHVLDPRTGWPAAQLASATVFAPTAAEADAFSTAFYVAGADLAREFCARNPQFAALLVTRPRPGQPAQVLAFNLNTKELKVA